DRRLTWRDGCLVGTAWTDGRELDDDPLVTLDERVDQQLVGPGLELEGLERIAVEGDLQRREVVRDGDGGHDDALDPASPVRDDRTTAEIGVCDRLLEQRTEQM